MVCDHPRPNSLLAEPIELASEPESQQPPSILNVQDRDNRRGVVGVGNGGVVGGVVGGVGGCSSSQRRSPPTSKQESEVNMDFQRIELASGAGVGSKEELEVDFKKLKQIKNRMRRTDWLFLNACAGEWQDWLILTKNIRSLLSLQFVCCKGGKVKVGVESPEWHGRQETGRSSVTVK